MKLSDQTNLIHVTDDINALTGILSDQAFRLKYCMEEFSFGQRRISSAVHAMVCFSSYSPIQLIDAPITYGRYGISLTEEWALRKGVHEVLYFERNSRPASALASLLEARQGKHGTFPENLRLPVMQIRCFAKNARGRNAKANNVNFDFRSEREWRFIPHNSEIGGARFSENRSTYDKRRDEMNAKVWKYKLPFKMDDIVQIYVKTAAEIGPLSKQTGIKSTLIKVSPWRYTQFKPTKAK